MLSDFTGAERPIVLYDYKPNRKIENAEEFLGDFRGYLHADGYPGYHKLPERITVVGCLAHARRKFADALKVLPMEQRRGLTGRAQTGFYLCCRSMRRTNAK